MKKSQSIWLNIAKDRTLCAETWAIIAVEVH